MACRVIKKLLGYEICIFEKEGTLLYSDPIVLIRGEGFSEIYNLQRHSHETGDIILRKSTREAVYSYIEDNVGRILSYM